MSERTVPGDTLGAVRKKNGASLDESVIIHMKAYKKVRIRPKNDKKSEVKAMKKTFKLILLLAVMICCFAIASTAAYADSSCGPSATYTINKGVVTISGTGKINDKAFYCHDEITEVHIGEGITEIGNYAFYGCDFLKNIYIPASVTRIGESSLSFIMNTILNIHYSGSCPTIEFDTFWATDAVAYVNDSWDDSTMLGYHAYSMKYIGGWRSAGEGIKYTFDTEDSVIFRGSGTIKDGILKNNKGVTKITIEEGITGTGSSCFENCSDLNTVSFPSTLKTIGENAFAGTGFTTVNIPEGITTLGTKAFAGCTLLKTLSLPSTITSFGKSVFYNDKALTSVTFADGLTTLGSSVFKNCEKLTAVKLPKGLKEIPADAFMDCLALSSVTIPDSVESIGEFAFYDDRLIKTIDIPGSVKSIGQYAFYRCYGLYAVTFHRGTESLAAHCFDACEALKTLSLPETMTRFGDCVFAGCKVLTSANIPVGTTTIPHSMFNACYALKNITIPETVTVIGGYSFSECKTFTEITIPAGVTSIGERAFTMCGNLSKVTCLAESVPQTEYRAFERCDKFKTLCVPALSCDKYAQSGVWGGRSIIAIESVSGSIFGTGNPALIIGLLVVLLAGIIAVLMTVRKKKADAKQEER